jgi:hypothetical protein
MADGRRKRWQRGKESFSGPLGPAELLSFIEMQGFADDWGRLRLNDDDLSDLQQAILARPRGAPVIAGTGGVRKLRFAPHRSAKGKSGGVRVCYVYFEKWGIVLLVIAYGKKETADLSPAQKQALRRLIERQEREWARRRK